MTLRTGKNGRYRYYACSIRARQGETGCKGRAIPMDKLDRMVVTLHRAQHYRLVGSQIGAEDKEGFVDPGSRKRSASRALMFTVTLPPLP